MVTSRYEYNFSLLELVMSCWPWPCILHITIGSSLSLSIGPYFYEAFSQTKTGWMFQVGVSLECQLSVNELAFSYSCYITYLWNYHTIYNFYTDTCLQGNWIRTCAWNPNICCFWQHFVIAIVLKAESLWLLGLPLGWWWHAALFWQNWAHMWLFSLEWLLPLLALLFSCDRLTPWCLNGLLGLVVDLLVGFHILCGSFTAFKFDIFIRCLSYMNFFHMNE